MTQYSDTESHSHSVPPSVSIEKGKAGDGNTLTPLTVSNAEFVAGVFSAVPDGTSPAVCSKPGNPMDGGWAAQRVGDVAKQCPPNRNNYLNTASFIVDETGAIKATNDQLAAYHAVMFDDLGTKIPWDRVDQLGPPSWQIETSPDNFQVGYILDAPLTDIAQVQAMLKAYSRAGLSDPGSLTKGHCIDARTGPLHM